MICFSSGSSHISPHVVPSPFFRTNFNFSSVPVRGFVKSRSFRGSPSGDGRKPPPVESSPGFDGQFSRTARTEAQGVLFDYLHCTRSLTSVDAEHISKNSPHFVNNLLRNVDGGDKDLGRSLSKFLRYNPINEFEPFLESLGIPHPELQKFLPRDSMFLGDDSLMLENFRTLSGYGIPRSQMGRIFKDAREIFEYDFGVLGLKLRAYENLGLSKFTVIKLVMCCPSLLIGNVDERFAKVLEKLSIHGIDKDDVSLFLSDKTYYDWGRIIDTIEFVESYLLEDKQLGILFKSNPGLLFSGSGKNVYVLICQLLKVGVKMEEVRLLFMDNPHFITEKCLKNFSGGITFLVELGLDTETITRIVLTHVELLASHSLRRPLTVFRHAKLTKEQLSDLIRDDPLKLFILASKTKLDSDHAMVESNKQLAKKMFLMKLGFIENSEEMTKAMKRFRGRGDQLQDRFNCLLESGLDYNAVTAMVKQVPTILNQSRDVLEKKINFLTNRLHYPVAELEVFPAYLCYDMERIVRRISMYIWLRERGKAKPMLSLSTILACSDARFIRYFVDIHPEGGQVWESLKPST
ncbi:hypothetical protein MLD38_010157 [Melastoma candidum]|uniref:Uncharacterized protein n=1 Tax=Melastoma candidum TaxID=119954 RepID=A0ACB9R7A6_9MYRT|nr:hypothetical protein MLD38_010157 [Melastoma candidum]